MHHRLLTGLAAALLLTGAAAAQPDPAPGGRHGPRGADGEPGHTFLSPGGEPFRGGAGLADWFKAADADHDGALDLAEFRADAMRFFKLLDADGDGQVDGQENTAYETKIAPEITQVFAGGGPRGGGRRKPFISRANKHAEPRQGAARFSLLNEAQPVRGADFDLNQRVSAEEWARAAGRRFALLDGDGDGKLTLESLAPHLPWAAERR
jgi:hypothetical protein